MKQQNYKPSDNYKDPVKYDTQKTDWMILPYEALEEVAKVMEYGSKKYSRNNWKAGTGFSWTRITNSLLRHIFSWIKGEDLDPETGYSHLAHAACNVLFLLYYTKYKDIYINDDRV